MTPDRFDVMVSAAEWHSGKTWVVSSVMVVKLLRREHAAVRRMVKKLMADCPHTMPDEAMLKSGWLDACYDLLAALDARKKGSR